MISDIFAKTLKFLNGSILDDIGNINEIAPELLPDILEKEYGARIEGFLPSLARLELALSAARNGSSSSGISSLTANPTLSVVPVSWKNLHSLVLETGDPSSVTPGNEMVLVWRKPGSEEILIRPAMNDDLLALKTVVEGIGLRDLSDETGLRIADIESIIEHSVDTDRKSVV